MARAAIAERTVAIVTGGSVDTNRHRRRPRGSQTPDVAIDAIPLPRTVEGQLLHHKQQHQQIAAIILVSRPSRQRPRLCLNRILLVLIIIKIA